ncbi:MAG: glutamine-hydrolyzing GMP synthase, partial [Candidatus Pacebacteria bacterium]|nr:glutamine-hydrolyzing GMP synthase [Candidatus Paceibacterota bacterium]
GIRCLCNEVTKEIGNEEEINNNIQELVDTIDNSLKGYAIPLRSVGVQGDVRTYRHPAVIEGKASWNTLEKVSTKLTNSVPDINRVIYRLTEKRENQENEENLETGMYITQKRLDVLREADNIAMEMLNEHDVNNKVWQMPTILVPWGADGKESIILRPVGSMEAMTAEFSKLDNVFVKKLAENIMATGLFSAVFFDVTNKPPGTIEWE